MIRYRDSGSTDAHACPGHWFDDVLVAGISAFRGQFGFFRFGAIRKYADAIRTTAVAGYPVNLVLGSNPTDRLTAEDVQSVLGMLSGGTNAHLTIVALQNALFHPKVAHVIGADGVASGMVGSPNLTELALGVHVESWIELTSDEITNPVLQEIACVIDRWHTLTEAGVFQVRSSVDLDQLLADGILITQAERQRARSAAGAGSSVRSVGRGTRRVRWRPPAVSATVPSDEREEPGIEFEPDDVTVSEVAAVTEPDRVPVVVFRWTKKLSKSDVNKNAQNERNLLSLGVGRGRMARVMDDIDDIRNKMMANERWDGVGIGGRPAESTTIKARVVIGGHHSHVHTLEVIHAPHRGSGQNNYHTSIRWDADLARILRTQPGRGFEGHWAVLERDDTGSYSLTISANEPKPRSIGLRS